MSRYRRTYACEDCGRDTTRMRDTDQPLICPDCTLARMADTCRQLAAKSGPYYDQWSLTAGPRGRPRRSKDG